MTTTDANSYGVSPNANQQSATTARSAQGALAIKEISSGVMMIVLGLVITIGTLALRLPIFVVSWGPVVFGIRRVVRGMKLLAKA